MIITSNLITDLEEGEYHNGKTIGGGGEKGNDDDDGSLKTIAIRTESVLLDGEITTTMIGQSSEMIIKESFRNEPKDSKDEILGDVTFIADDGEGNASIMKPRKPVVHTWSINNKKKEKTTGYDDNNDKNLDKDDDYSDDDDDDADTLTQFRNSKLHIVSSALFVFSSLLYLGMACMIIDYYRHYDDDASWWNYFVNCTDDQFLPKNVTMADDDHTWMVWYNESAFFEDDNVWLPKIANSLFLTIGLINLYLLGTQNPKIGGECLDNI